MTLYEKDDVFFKIMQDIDPICPRTFDNFGTIVTWHRRYTLGDKQPKESPQEFLDNLEPEDLIIPIYMLDHSDITISTLPFGDPFDSGRLGYIYATTDSFREFKVTRAEGVKILEAEVETYNYYIQGEVYGFEKYEMRSCDTCGHAEKEPLDGCWGFYGSDHKKSGLLESAGIEDINKWKIVR